MDAIVKILVSVNPRQETGDIGYLWEEYNSFLELYLAAGNKLTLKHSVIDLFVHDFLLVLRDDLVGFVLAQDRVELRQKLIVQTVNGDLEIIIAFVNSQEDVVVLCGKIRIYQTADVQRIFPLLQRLCYFLEVVYTCITFHKLLVWINIENPSLKLLQRCLNFLPELLDSDYKVIFILLDLKLFLGCSSKVINGVFFQFSPMFLGYLIGRVKELNALLRMLMQVFSTETSFSIMETVGIETNDIYPFGGAMFLLLHRQNVFQIYSLMILNRMGEFSVLE